MEELRLLEELHVQRFLRHFPQVAAALDYFSVKKWPPKSLTGTEGRRPAVTKRSILRLRRTIRRTRLKFHTAELKIS